MAADALGRFDIEEELHVDALGRIVRCVDTDSGERLLGKELLPPRSLPDEQRNELTQRFLHSARACQESGHVGLAGVREIVQTESQVGAVYELPAGEPLSARLAAGEATDLTTAVSIVSQLGSALGNLQQRHAEPPSIDPRFIYVNELGEATWVDLGFSHLAPSEAAGGSAEAVAYCSPEELRGQPPNEASIVFSLAALLYHLITGDVPFPGATRYEILDEIDAHTPGPIWGKNPQAPHRLDDVIHQALSPDFGDRPSNLSDFMSLLAAVPLPLAQAGDGTLEDDDLDDEEEDEAVLARVVEMAEDDEAHSESSAPKTKLISRLLGGFAARRSRKAKVEEQDEEPETEPTELDEPVQIPGAAPEEEQEEQEAPPPEAMPEPEPELETEPEPAAAAEDEEAAPIVRRPKRKMSVKALVGALVGIVLLMGVVSVLTKPRKQPPPKKEAATAKNGKAGKAKAKAKAEETSPPEEVAPSPTSESATSTPAPRRTRPSTRNPRRRTAAPRPRQRRPAPAAAAPAPVAEPAASSTLPAEDFVSGEELKRRMSQHRKRAPTPGAESQPRPPGITPEF